MRLQPFEAIVAQYGAMVLRVCRATVGPEAAEDAWSETFLAALKAYPNLRPDSNIEAWLVTIAHRKAIDEVRREARRPAALDDRHDPIDPGVTPGGWQADLHGAMRDLPSRQRQAVAYHYLAGMPYAEVARVIGGSPEAARKAGSDGIATLRRLYLEGKPR